MKTCISLLITTFLVTGCSLIQPKKQTQTREVAHDKTWSEMFDKKDWAPVNSAKLTETNKVVK